MYTFDDKGGNSLTLRPENTAGKLCSLNLAFTKSHWLILPSALGVARSFVSGREWSGLPRGYFYKGPMFRYERPQKGRLRQFHQVGVELLGSAAPCDIVQTIQMATSFLASLQMGGFAHVTIPTFPSPPFSAALFSYLFFIILFGCAVYYTITKLVGSKQPRRRRN